MKVFQKLALFILPIMVFTACDREQVQPEDQATGKSVTAAARAAAINPKLIVRNKWKITTYIEVRTTKNKYTFNLLLDLTSRAASLLNNSTVVFIKPVPGVQSISGLELSYDPNQRYYTYNNEPVTYIDLNKGDSSDDIKFKDGGDNITYKADARTTGDLIRGYRNNNGIPTSVGSVADNDGIYGIAPARVVGSWNNDSKNPILYVDITPL